MNRNQKTEVLLVNPPRAVPQRGDFPPLGLAYICAVLKKNGINAELIDACAMSWWRIIKVIKDKAPAVIGIPCWTIERSQTFKLAKLIRQTLPSTKIILGGYHATAFPEHMFRLAFADAVVIGEGEMTMLELVETLRSNGDLKEVRGIVFQNNGDVISTPPRRFIDNLDSLPFPAYSEVDFNAYLGLPEIEGKATALITSRGCPYQCIFCSASKFWHRKWRARSARNVIDEIGWLYTHHSVKAFMFFDDNFTIDKERAIQICQLILEKDLHIDWVACSHVNQVDKDILYWMRKAGCYRIDYGVESGSPVVLDNIKKKQTVERIERTFALTHEAGIKPRAYLMIGNPGEDQSTIDETITLMRRIKPYDSPSGQILWILPDTEIYNMAKSKGIISDDYWLENDSMVYYTGEHTEGELKSLRDKMAKALAKDQENPIAYVKYLTRKLYYKYPILQKLRKWRMVKQM